ncbi:ABC transporter ATP-binding protein [Neoroseomonas lacus]|uniref:ATP-binding protein n=1 Tax=Neoroseomonas lacus TaxID=287609 RepID=A0A917NMF2_9PROT|nr:ABC transporter ATP-binding protein [Neoroseomonas lacus]GGJ11752.1 ATP-binding protein [Neoroseomonas lacus]
MIRFEGVRKSFGGATALAGLDLVVPEGAFAVLLGGSGAGKSTALRMINRLIDPDAGRVLLRGRDVAAEAAPALRRRIGYVIQGIGLFPHWTVARNIGAVPRLLGWDEKRIAARVDELLTLLRLDPAAYRDRMPAQLSGGQAQRIGVARALAADPDILLMDEPFGALDAVTRQALQQEMARLHAATGKTILLVTHDVEEALSLATRLAVMADGRLLQEGAPRDLLDAPADPRVRDLLDGGAIGMRRLSLVTAASLAGPTGEAPAALPHIPAAATGRDALEAMLAARAEAVVLLDAAGAPAGLVALRDLLRA